MGNETEVKPRVYVGTYAKYNNGSIKGAWLDLEAYADKDDFLAACKDLHKDESDPELMYQDFEGFPREYYGESEIKESLWDWLGMSEDDRELLAVYSEHMGGDVTLDDAQDALAGKSDSLESWAENFLDETGGLDSIPENLRSYFDYEKYARDLELGGDVFTVDHDGECWIFWNR